MRSYGEFKALIVFYLVIIGAAGAVALYWAWRLFFYLMGVRIVA